ncbi:MAG: class II aldolase/adducin family protein [Chloroflexi bacterium]|nr:class II aldolase/adducin family protein [Chloroflexota bacterium]MCL5075984.1 class II aldolase/adducin family protein [Chloroflexota bacterium]
MTLLLAKLRGEVALTALQMFRWGLVRGTSGNVSARDLKTGYVVITPSGRDYETITAEDVVVITASGEVVEGRWRPSNETPLHTVWYRERRDVHAVVHTHAPYAVALSMVCPELPAAMPEIIFKLGGSVPVAPYTTPDTEQLGLEALRIIGDRKGVILQNHGTVNIGETLDEALHGAVSLEDAAYIYYLALQVGKPFLLPPEEVCKLRGRAGYKD